MKNKIAKIIALTFFPLLISTEQSIAQDVNVDTFEPPKGISRKNPEYPYRALNRGDEGSVELNMMVDENGKPFEVMVLNSSGGEEFINAALNAVKKWNFEPAKIAGKPVVGSSRAILSFRLEGATGASTGFINSYKAFYEALKSKSKEEAQPLLEKLEAAGKNRYEIAFLGLAQFLYASKYGNSLEQMYSLRRALSFSRDAKDEVFLPPNEARIARRELMKLQAANRYYRDALDTYKYFGVSGDKEGVDTFSTVAAQIAELEKNDKPFDVPVELNRDGHFQIRLLKHKVYATAIEGKLAEFKVLCDKKYVGFPVEADVIYDIPTQWGVCSLEVEGNAATKFKLMQQ